MIDFSFTFTQFIIMTIYAIIGFIIMMTYTSNCTFLLLPVIKTRKDLILFVLFMPVIIIFMIVFNIMLIIMAIGLFPIMFIVDSIIEIVKGFGRDESRFKFVRSVGMWLNKRIGE